MILLARHLGTVCGDRGADAQLRRDCMTRIAELRRQPVLKILAYRDVAHDEPAKKLFHSEGRSALCRLADALGLAAGSFDIRSNRGGPAVSGEITLHGDDIWVQLSVGLFGPGREVCFRKVRGRSDHVGDRNMWASVRELMTPERLASRIRKELHLPSYEVEAPRLVA